MRAVIQKVKRAKVTVEGKIVGEIENGLLVLLGVSIDDTEKDSAYILDKTLNLRVFEDENGKMNLSVSDVCGELLVVSQFTLYGDTRGGRRPSYIKAAPPEKANELYELFVAKARQQISKVQTGKFRAMMDVELINDGPVTILIDSEKAF